LFFPNFGECGGIKDADGQNMSMQLLTAPTPGGLLSRNSAPVKDAIQQRRTGEAARGAPDRQRQIVSVSDKAQAPWTGSPAEQACQSMIASYYVGPLND
jgi:hypothetical protein